MSNMISAQELRDQFNLSDFQSRFNFHIEKLDALVRAYADKRYLRYSLSIGKEPVGISSSIIEKLSILGYNISVIHNEKIIEHHIRW